MDGTHHFFRECVANLYAIAHNLKSSYKMSHCQCLNEEIDYKMDVQMALQAAGRETAWWVTGHLGPKTLRTRYFRSEVSQLFPVGPDTSILKVRDRPTSDLKSNTKAVTQVSR